MPRSPIDLNQMVRNVLQHVSPLIPDADCPIKHFEGSANTGFSLIKYIREHVDPLSIYEGVFVRHLGHLQRMVLAELIESFERFLKELAAVCVDRLAPFSTDDRFDEFSLKRAEQISAFVTSNSIGKALCESDTWINNESINKRFKSLLKFPFGSDWEFLFPAPNQPPDAERSRAATLAILWQIRHNLAHNLGVITHSDSMRFRMLVNGAVPADCRLSPQLQDLSYVKRFLSETAAHTNQRVGQRLAEVLSRLHAADPTLFDAQMMADEVSQRFAYSVTINGVAGTI